LDAGGATDVGVLLLLLLLLLLSVLRLGRHKPFLDVI
jgi:hypothetical protein